MQSPDTDPAADFLTRFFAGTGHKVELRALDIVDGPNGPESELKGRTFTRRPKQVRCFITDHAQLNIYFGCVTREGGGTKEHCREVVALWADIDFKDIPEERARERVAQFPIQPSLVVESGGGLHLYWLLTAPELASEFSIEPILRGLAQALGGDRKVAEVAHIMRLPGTVNYKYTPPRACRVLDAYWDRRYALRDFERFAEQSRLAQEKGNTQGGERIPKTMRHRTLTSLAGSMRRRGMSQAAIEAALLVENATRCDPPKPEGEVRRIARDIAKKPAGESDDGEPKPTDPWGAAESMATFLSGEEVGAEFLDGEKRLVARECVTEIFSPRGLGKSLFALWLALVCALRGLRVLYLNRDNSRFVVKGRLRRFGAEPETPNLKVITREKCPPLTNALAWATFPYADYDVVILDSLDAAAEGVGEQDSTKPVESNRTTLGYYPAREWPRGIGSGQHREDRSTFSWERGDRGPERHHL